MPSDILLKARKLSSAINTATNFKKIATDFYRNLVEDSAQDLRSESLVPERFVLYLPTRALPSNFGLTDASALFRILMTKVGREYDVMRVRILDGTQDASQRTLYFLVNPSQMQVNNQKLQGDYITRSGPKAEFWGNKPIELNFDGSSGGFYGLDNEGSGYNRRNFFSTLSFKNIVSLVTFYKNNGLVYGDTDLSGSSLGSKVIREKDVRRVDLVELTYRDKSYLGSFNSMNLSFSSSNPARVSYSFSFTAYREITLNR